MEKDHHHHHNTKDHQNYSSAPSLISPNTKQPSPKKPQQSSTPNTNNDRLKRDEWSEGAVSTLLEAYEGKWILRNRAKLKGQDWEDVAKQVSGRSNNSKSMKTQTQCKNKIESMKKRYRSESAAAEASVWPLYPRLDLLLRGNSGGGGVASPPVKAEQPVVAVAQLVLQGQNSNGSNEVDRVDKVDDHNNVGTNSAEREPESERNLIADSDSSASTPAVYTEKAHEKKAKVSGQETEDERKKQKMKNGNKRKDRDHESWGTIGESIRWVAQVVARCEEARMETMKEIERMRAEAEGKRAEMDLKRTEIIANTQLEIAKLFANNRGGTSDSSNLRTGRS